MSPIVDDKKYAADTRPYGQAAVAEGWTPCFDESPISRTLTLKDICIYKPGVPKPGVVLTEENFRDPDMYDVLPDVNKNGKWSKTSWDSFSYALLMGHNVWTHIEAVQQANRDFDAGTWPYMMWYEHGDHAKFADIVEAIFAAPTREESEAIIEYYRRYWMYIIGTRGDKGRKAENAKTMFGVHFTYDEPEQIEQEDFDSSKLDNLEKSV